MQVNSLSISVRLRRLRTETAHVSVPISDDLLLPDDQGTGNKLDVDKILDAALRLGRLESTDWEPEGEPEIQPHPIQTPPKRASTQ